MITREQAIELGRQVGRTLYHRTLTYTSDGSAVRCRVNGACKTWKTRPDDFRLPVKHGLRHCFYITQSNADEWCVEEPTATQRKNA